MKAPFAPAFAPFIEFRALERLQLLRTDHGTFTVRKLQPPPIPKSALRLLESFFLAELAVGGL
jgi:hypothetical protein